MYLKFLDIWNNAMVIGTLVLLNSSVLVLIFHKIRTGSYKDLKQKYDYLTENDIKMQMTAIWLFAAEAFRRSGTGTGSGHALPVITQTGITRLAQLRLEYGRFASTPLLRNQSRRAGIFAPAERRMEQ